MTEQIKVCVAGCDDQTEVIIEATAEELTFLNRLALLINDTRQDVCMPSMRVNDQYLETPQLEDEEK